MLSLNQKNVKRPGRRPPQIENDLLKRSNYLKKKKCADRLTINRWEIRLLIQDWQGTHYLFVLHGTFISVGLTLVCCRIYSPDTIIEPFGNLM